LASEFVRRCNVLGLTGFVAPGQKNHDFHTALLKYTRKPGPW
jgi:hypothetical protein